ncbi:MAG: 3-dehydroquinate synthase [Candidatus Omnitrophica bacterium]|jgi:3-dehydroquinate synthase|nr:3-dehydroquinate synthase [Candidatus Omnitrophota bacterium]
MKVIKINLSKNSYNVYIKQNLLESVGSHIKEFNLGNFAIILASRSVFTFYKNKIEKSFAKFPHSIIVLPDGETAKTQASLFKIIQGIIKLDKLNRKVFIVCMGGGTVGDVGGFASSVYKRGIPYVQVPTTLLAQIDASIGGKTAIDLKEAKNILGAFYQPKAVFVDPGFLNTLKKKQISEGLAEAVKYAVIKSSAFFSFLVINYREILSLKPSSISKVIDTCAGIKAKIVEADETEKKSIRTILNFGHTFAHALEAASKYKKVSHGEAVSLGMLYAAFLSKKAGSCGMNEIYQIRDLLKKFELPVKCKYDLKAIYKTMSYDKKNVSGRFRMVLLEAIGKVKVVDGIPEGLISKTLKEYGAFI